MAAIDFPTSPTPNQLFSAAGRTWKWNNSAAVWETVVSTGVPPNPHASSHELGGTDELLLNASQVEGIVTDANPQIFTLMGA
jgi:hypothetical protein